MSRRKEHLKKSLGISEYPWSSDDDDQPMPADAHLLRRQIAEPRPSVADLPGTSGQQCRGFASCPLSQGKATAKRPWFLTPGHNSNESSSVGASEPSTRLDATRSSSNTSATALRERVGRHNAAADIQRILAIRKVTQGRVGTVRTPKSNSSLYSMSSRGLPGPSRNPIFTPSIASATQKAHQNALRRLQSTLNHSSRNMPFLKRTENPFLARMSPRSQAPEPAPAPAPAPHSDPVHISETSAPERDAQQTESVPPFDAEILPMQIENTSANQEPIEVDPSHTSAMSLAEEELIVDVHDYTDGNASAKNTPENPVVNKDVELNQIITVDANEESKRSQVRRRDGNLSPDDGEPHTVKEFNQNLLRLLECPVCLEWMEPPMSQCRRGHLVCARCRARLASCPVCRTTFSSVRNRAMEGVAEMVRYPCRHMCGREVRLRRRNTHEASCGARRYPCPAPACVDRPHLPRDDLADHLQSKHMSLLKIGRKHKFSVKVNSEQHDTWVIVALHEYFLLRVDVDIRTWGVIVYVAYIGPKCNAKNFTYEVSVVGQHNSRKLVYSRATHSDLESLSLNVSRQDCFHLTLDQALNFLRIKNRHCEPDKFLDFIIEISKCENDTKEDSDS